MKKANFLNIFNIKGEIKDSAIAAVLLISMATGLPLLNRDICFRNLRNFQCESYHFHRAPECTARNQIEFGKFSTLL